MNFSVSVSSSGGHGERVSYRSTCTTEEIPSVITIFSRFVSESSARVSVKRGRPRQIWDGVAIHVRVLP